LIGGKLAPEIPPGGFAGVFNGSELVEKKRRHVLNGSFKTLGKEIETETRAWG